MTDEPLPLSDMPRPGASVVVRLEMLDGTTRDVVRVVPATGWERRIVVDGRGYHYESPRGTHDMVYRYRELA